jgi:UDP-N-acetylmuramyl pentapeptide phosphotransferase/UDP-N-acetylglucosamine-1-phosphate transferase
MTILPIVFLVLLGVELLYFRIADRFNIIDKPNERSSHTKITLRGGGIIFPISVLLYTVYSGNYIWFTLGLVAAATISFLDDILTLSGKIRILVHLAAVSLLFHQVELFNYYWVWIIMGYILVIGTINAYNFMDGINGITGAYSLSILIPLFLLNLDYKFVDESLLIFIVASVMVFLIFNFRKRAKCFAGDVGSVSMAFIVLFLITKLIIATGDYKYILLLAVYGVDSVLTIVHRLFLKENIFKAHRKHLYQYLSNEMKLPHLVVSTLYAIIQFGIAIWLINSDDAMLWWQPVAIFIILGSTYIIVKYLILSGKLKPLA